MPRFISELLFHNCSQWYLESVSIFSTDDVLLSGSCCIISLNNPPTRSTDLQTHLLCIQNILLIQEHVSKISGLVWRISLHARCFKTKGCKLNKECYSEA